MGAVALVPAACRDDDEPAAAPPTTTSTTTAPTTAITSTSPTTTTPAATRECGQVGFTPDSEDVAGDITATGVPCDEARALVEVAGRRTSSGGPPSLEVDGWRCVVTHATDDPLPRSDYRCTRGRATVTFGRS
jgi:hypothetical protein